MTRVKQAFGWAVFLLWMSFWAMLISQSDPRFPLAQASRMALTLGALAAAAAPALLWRLGRRHVRLGLAPAGRVAALVFLGSGLAVVLLYLAPMAAMIKLAGTQGPWGVPNPDLNHFAILLYMMIVAVPAAGLVMAGMLWWSGRSGHRANDPAQH